MQAAVDAELARVDFPDKLAFLFDHYRYKVAYGGRGSAKSWSYARALILRAVNEKTLILCTREIQKSIEESVYRLLVNQIHAMGLSGAFEILKTKIICRATKSEFVFAGLRHNMDNLKSFEGANIVWIEEAHTVSKESWDKLIPTIRAAGSEIWITFNPELEDDETYQRFVLNPPDNSHVCFVNYEDNPWFPDVLQQEMEDCKRRSLKDWRHIWRGECMQAIDGAIFAEELEAAKQEGRITRVPVQDGVPVQTYWDLGQSDATAIWFVQVVGREFRLIDYYQANGHKMPHYIGELARRGYLYGEHYLPHDADYEQLAAQSTIKEQMQDALRDNPALGKAVNVVERVPKKAIGINAARTVFEQCLFDSERTKDGLQCLRRYHYKKDPDTGRVSKEPVHDMWSHGADAFLQFAQHIKLPPARQKKREQRNLRKYV